MGHAPPLLTPCIQGTPSCCAEARDADRVERPGCDPPAATTTRRRYGEDDRTAPMAPPHTTVHRAQRPWRCAQARDVDRQPHARHDQPTATTLRCHHHTCQWDAPPAPPTRPVNQAQGLWHRAQVRDIGRLPPPRRDPPTATMPCRHHHDRHQGHPGHTTPPPSARNSPSVAQKSAAPASWGRATTYQR